MTEMQTTSSTNGEAPLPRRVPRRLLPGTWTGHSVRVEYAAAEAYNEWEKGQSFFSAPNRLRPLESYLA